MTRKDFILIAEAVAEARRLVSGRVPSGSGQLFAVDNVARELADALGRDNSRFDKARFLKACGVQS